MKRILKVTLAPLLLAGSVVYFGRDNLALSGSAEISKLMGGAGVSAQAATIIDAQYSSAVTASTVPNTTNAIDLGTSSKVFRSAYVGTSVIFSALAGVKENIGTLAAAGSTQTDAAAIATTVARVTAADGTKGVKLPALAGIPAGRQLTIINSDVTNALKVYSNAAGETIDGQAGTTAVSVAAKLLLRCWAYDATNWYCEKGVTPF
jgi:hypothetical protein